MDSQLQLRTKLDMKSTIIACEIADLTGDGKSEIIFCTYDSYLYVYTQEKSGLIELGKQKLASQITTLDVWDLDGDGSVEIFVGLRDKILRIYNFKGNKFIEKTKHKFRDMIHHVTVGDVFTKNLQQLVVCAGKFITIFTYKRGALREEGQIRQPKDIYKLRIADVDNDGVNDLIFGGRDNDIQVIRYKSRFFQENIGSIRFDYYIKDLQIMDIDQDGSKDIVVSTADGMIGIYKFMDGTFLPSYVDKSKDTINAISISKLKLGDNKYIVFIGGTEKTLRLFDFDGSSVTECGAYHTDTAIRTVNVADLDGDGPKEVIVGCEDGQIYVYEILK